LFAWYIPANPYSLLQPHLPLLLLQTSSALSNIFPEIRLDAAKLVHLLLQHVPTQVTAGWPVASLDGASSSRAALEGGASGESTILEGLRLALGLGGEKATSAQNRMSAGGKLVILKAILAFVTAALRGGGGSIDEEAKATLPRETFGIWRSSGERETKNRGKERAVVGPDSVEQGWYAGIPDWGVDFETNTSWEVGRLGGNGELGGTEGVVQALSVSCPPLPLPLTTLE
jgi:pre-rRNA-processing protein IPI1